MASIDNNGSYIARLRRVYHQDLLSDVIRIRSNKKKNIEYPNFADGDNTSSIRIAQSIVSELGGTKDDSNLSEQTVGQRFEQKTQHFVEKSFELLQHLRPGKWKYIVGDKNISISLFDQYEHLDAWAKFVKKLEKEESFLASSFGGGYIVKPDIVVGRVPISDDEINGSQIEKVVNKDAFASLTPLRATNNKNPRYILHASISCKWTLRSDRSQNARTEALNLIRNRRGHLPHIMAVTAEPMPTRLATLALGTGDIDCVYHFALHELKKAIETIGNEDQRDAFESLMQGRRIRDISDLPFDLAM